MEFPVVEVKVDWVTLTKRGFWTGIPHAGSVSCTADALIVARQAFADLGIRRTALEMCPAGTGYHYGFKDYATGIRVSVAANLEKQGVMLVCSGQAIALVDDVAVRVSAALDSGWRCSRMDVAFDVFNSGGSVDALASEYFEAHPPPAKRKASYVASGGGSTLYIGSRHSAKMLRVYDKGKEQQTSLDWIRFEMEYKKEYIHVTAAQMLMDPASAIHDVLDLIDLPPNGHVMQLQRFVSDVPAPTVVIPRTKTNRALWFHTTVLKAFEGLASDSMSDAYEVLEAFKAALDNGVTLKPVEGVVDIGE